MRPIYWAAIFIVVFGIFAIWHTIKTDPEEEHRKKREEWERRDAQRRAKEDDKTPVKTRLLTEQSQFVTKESLTSAVGRAALGHMVAGPLGAVIGAGTGEKTTYEEKSQVFKVWYKSGREAIESAVVGTARWKELIEKLEE